MSGGLSKDWRNWRRRVTNLAEALALEHGGNRLPIPLREIAERRCVKHVVFQPMWLDGSTSVYRDGFTVYIRAEEWQVADFQRRWDNPEDSGRSLPTRTRFTVAHEICHTFFFDIDKPITECRVDVKRKKTIQNVERECNLGAARMLLPERFLKSRASRGNLWDVESLVELRREAGVSPSCLLNRLKHSSAKNEESRVIAYIVKEGDDFRIHELLMPLQLKRLFPKMAKDSFVKQYLYEPDLILWGGSDSEVVTDMSVLTAKRKAVQRCVISATRVYGGNESFFFAVYLKGGPRVIVPSRMSGKVEKGGFRHRMSSTM